MLILYYKQDTRKGQEKLGLERKRQNYVNKNE